MPGISRYVYSPKVWAFVKRGSGDTESIQDLTKYLVSGSVTRNLDAVSSAQLTIRNPNRIWTQWGGNRATPAFRPMDPITIFMMAGPRMIDAQPHIVPIQVFTGYLDRTPFYQLYPGTVTLFASCTLKRLQYTFFDAGLPYINDFLSAYGWFTDPATGSIRNKNAETTLDGTRGQFSDSGIGKILYGTLKEIGKWGDSDIYIEQLPKDLPGRLATVFRSFEASNTQSITEYQTMLEAYVGVGAEGGAAPSDNTGSAGVEAGSPKGAAKCVPVIVKEANAAGIPADMAVATCFIESGFDPKIDNQAGSGAHGYYQWMPDVYPPGSYQGWGLPKAGWKASDAEDIGRAANAFCRTAALAIKKHPEWKNDKMTWALRVQGADDSGNRPHYESVWADTIQKAHQWINRFASSSSGSTPRDSGPANNPGDTPTPTVSSSSSVEAKIAAMKAKANAITQKDYPYVWGGGHSVAGHPSIGQSGGHGYDGHTIGYDCSGAVSAVMNAGGFLDTPEDSGTMMNDWEPGAGRVTVFATSGHTFMSIDGQFFGTSAGQTGNPLQSNGGAGWLPTPSSSYMAGFTKRHPKGLSGDPKWGKEGDKPQVNAASLDLHPINAVTTAGTDGKRTEKVKLIVIHSTESSNIEGTADLYGVVNALKGQGLSIHVANDGEGKCIRMVEDNMIAQHVKSFNSVAVGIEQIGFAENDPGPKTVVWPDKQVDNTAKWVAFWANKFDIPIQQAEFDSAGNLTKPGVHSHKGIPNNDHTDPGDNYPMGDMLDKARGYLGQVQVGGNSTGTGDPGNTSPGAAAFAAQVILPGVEDTATSLFLQGAKSLMNDKPLLPFVQQLAGASLRRFQSLPDGRFFAFYPDYFGEFGGGQNPYWEISDIEILDGTIELTDENLVTHEYVVGETIPFNGIGLPAMLMSSGVVTVFNAFGNAEAKGFVQGSDNDEGGHKKAIEFLQRYGARPELYEAPMIRSPFFELLLAWQRFMLSWSQQFLTEFTFTFMPELYPGGKVGFKDHGIQVFIESVTHSFDMEAGFTTTAQISAPQAYGNSPSLQANLVSNPF